jgi:hypothetical protein
MSDPIIFTLGISAASGLSVATLVHLHRPLRPILSNLCGTSDRASFWCAFSNIALFLVPLIFMLDYQPEPNSGEWLWVLAAVLKRGILGLTITVVTLGFVITRSIRHGEVQAVLAQHQKV